MATKLNLRAQFAHLTMAGQKRTPSKLGKERKWTAAELLAEADRLPGNASHVKNPLAPNWLRGSRKIVEQRADAWRSQAREANGRARLRSTSPNLACAVVSWPREREAEWPAYRDDVVRYFARKLGADRIPGIVEHLDESHQHIHLYFVPRDGESFDAVHPGYAARKRARKEPGNHVRIAYTEAMKIWQDELFEATGRARGLKRIGVGRERLSRADHMAKKKAAELEIEAKKLYEKRRELVDGAKALIVQRERFALEPAGQHAAALTIRDEEIAKLRRQLAEVTARLDEEQFRNREYQRKVSTQKPSHSKP